jgi:hypothetical protein
MADLQAISRVLYRYCYAHDSRDVEMLASTFAKDVELLGQKGRDAVAAVYANGYKTLTAQRRHVLSNIMLLEDGDDRAVVQSYITLYLIRDGKLEVHLSGIYRDHVVIEDGEWKILTREAQMDSPYNPGDVVMPPGLTER